MCDESNRCAPVECRLADEEPGPSCSTSGGRLPRRSKLLSSTILDYCTHYGQHRDLERFLRYRKHTGGPQSSSDESSLLAALSAHNKSGERRVSSLSLAATGPSGEQQPAVQTTKKIGSQSARSDRSEAPGAKSKKSATSRSENDLSDVKSARTKRSDAKAMAHRSLYSLTSNIEINISNLDLAAQGPASTSPVQVLHRESCATQTVTSDAADAVVEPKAVTFAAEVDTSAPGEQQPPTDSSLNSFVRPTSADSSIVSMVTAAANKPRLEWDSMADVGYEKACQTDVERHTRLVGSDSNELSPFERATLQKFFTERGMPFDRENLLAALEDRQEEVEEKIDAAVVVEEDEEDPTLTEVFEEEQKKDQRNVTETQTETASNSAVGRLFAGADAVSTPITAATNRRWSRSEQRSAETQTQPVLCHSVPVNTSAPTSRRASVASVTPTSPPPAQNSVGGDDGAVETSFTFVPGALIDDHAEVEQKEEKENAENRASAANVPPTDKVSITSSSRSKSKPPHKEASNLYDSHTDEIIRTILCSEHSTSSSSAAVNASKPSVETSTASSGGSTSMMRDLRRGIELLDRLVESERLNKATKKRLVKKIVNGLLRAKYNISSTNTSLGDDDTTTATSTGQSKTEEPSVVSRQSQKQRRPEAAPRPARNKTLDWLQPLTRSELDYERQRRKQQSPSPASKNAAKLQWIHEKIQDLVTMQTELFRQQERKLKASALYENTTTVNDMGASSTDNHYYCEVTASGPAINPQYNSTTSTYASTKPSETAVHEQGARRHRSAAKEPRSTGADRVGGAAVADDSSDSPLLVQKFVRNRTKLRTPCDPREDDDDPDDDAGDGALNAYARSKQRHFLKQYTASSADDTHKSHARDLIYAHPYGEPPPLMGGAFHRHHPAQHRVHTATTATNTGGIAAGSGGGRSSSSGNTFLSSNSVSIPEMRSSSYPEGTSATASRHREPSARHRSASVAIQTSDSLLKPILKQQQRSKRAAHVSQPPPPPPPPVSYTITFHAGPAQPAQSRQPSTAAVAAPPTLTVQEYLRQRCPDFLAAADARRDCVRHLNALRRRRNEQRQLLFQQPDAGDDVAELCARLHELEPQPLAQRRCFSTRELLRATRARCERLPEVRERAAALRTGRVRRAQRLMRDVFARELQRRALRGRVNLSNSVMVT